jgi:hypothetical protein
VILGWLLAAVVAGAAPGASATESAQQALMEGRFDEARRQFEALLANGAPSYDVLVGLGVALGRLGLPQEASERLTQAIGLAPNRSEAWLERGGLRFLAGRHGEAVADLRASLARQDDPYARDLLASSLFLVGDPDAALRQWNRIGRPELRVLSIEGLVHTRPDLVRHAIRLKEGALLSAAGLGASRLRLRELGVFDRATLRLVPVGEGKADVQVALSERHGFAGSPLELVAAAGVNAVSERVELQYVNVLGDALTIGGRYRWQPTRPEVSLAAEWAQPFGLDGRVRVTARRGRQRYAFGESLDRKIRALDAAFRRPVGHRMLVELGVAAASRSYSRPHARELPGSELRGRVGANASLLESQRQRLDGRFELARALGAHGSYTRGELSLAYKAQLGPGDELRRERSVLAVRVRVGALTAGAPLDELMTPGGGPDAEWPLRGHDQARDGVLGVMPLARSLAVANVEWRQRLYRVPFGEAGIVLFYDVGRLSSGSLTDTPSPRRSYHDVGVGVRFSAPGSAVIRLDVGFGLADRRHAVFLGLGQAF